MQVERRIHIPFFFLAHSTEHAHQLWLSQFQPHASPPPGICRAFVGHLSLKKICCNCSMVGPAHLYKSPRWGLGKGANRLYPTHGTRSKFDLMIEAKNILIGSSGFLEHYFVCNYNCNALQDRSQKVGF